VFYVGHVDKSSLYEILFHCNILSKHHHHLLVEQIYVIFLRVKLTLLFIQSDSHLFLHMVAIMYDDVYLEYDSGVRG
jgi:hypothetical protein